MRLGRGLNDAQVRKLLSWSVPVLGFLSLGLFLIPGLTSVAERDTAAPALEVAEPSWGVEPREGTGAAPGEAGLDSYAALEPYDPAGADSSPGIDDSWLESETGAGDEGDASTLACIIEPSQVIEIGSPVTGLIEKVHVERSDFVEAGQILVELESGAERAAVRLARAEAAMNEQVKSREASAALGKRRSARVKRLYEEETLSLDLREEVETEAEVARLELEQAHADKRLASLQLEQATALLKRRTIRSPIAGVVVDRMMSPGERVDEEAILKVAQIDPLRVEVILPSSMFGKIEVGMRAGVVPEFPGDSVHVASVTIVDRVIDAASGTFGVRLGLPNPEHKIPGGLHCQVHFLSE